MNCLVELAQVESYFSATRSQPWCSNSVKASMNSAFQRESTGLSLTIAMIKRILAILLLCGSAVYAAETSSPSAPAPANPPSEATIKQILEVMQARKLVDSMIGQMDTLMLQTIAQATQGQAIPPKIQKQIDQQRSEMMAMMKDLLAWEKLEPLYVRVYQKTFTQQELDGMLAFYKTPVGAAMIAKMPAVMQNTMEEMQSMMGPVMDKMQRMQKDVVAQMKADKNKGG
jgi:hypothetical protein